MTFSVGTRARQTLKLNYGIFWPRSGRTAGGGVRLRITRFISLYVTVEGVMEWEAEHVYASCDDDCACHLHTEINFQ